MSLKTSTESKGYEVKLPYGLKGNKLLHISKVDSGLACGCVCPKCKAKLVARKGSTAHHFAHHVSDNCVGALETTLHLLAKEVIEQSKSIVFPALFVKPPMNLPAQQIYPIRKISIDGVWVEQKYRDIQPDLIIKAGEEMFMLEIYVTHKVDEEKLAKIREYECPAIEIDLSSVPRDLPRAEVERLVISEVSNKKWLNSTRANHVVNELNTEYQRLLQVHNRQILRPRPRLNRRHRRL